MAFHDEVRLFFLTGPGSEPDDRWGVRRCVYVTYGRNGGATARCFMSGDVLGRVRGGGWDLTAGALEAAARSLFGTPRFDGAAGLAALRVHLSGSRVAVYDIGDTLAALRVLRGPVRRSRADGGCVACCGR